MNHTAEGGADGPTIHFKGLGNDIYYHLDPDDPARYRDFTGCGNSLNANHPIVTQYLRQCVEYWVREMHIDGLRFDLASVLARGEDGEVMEHAPVLWGIEFSEVTAGTKLIAEAWDTAGADLVGDFPGFRWAQWNGHFRDVVRRFVRGDEGVVAELATRIAGSSDLFNDNGGLPTNSVNYVTCHDGFTLHDLVAYNEKHNEANGEDNRDGHNANFSWNCGHEGPTEDPEIVGLRRRQARNHLAILLLSQGIPMLLSGDEVLRTQGGNNNAYCQDNALAWFDWDLLVENADMLRFTRELIALRRRHASLRRGRFFPAESGAGGSAIEWHGTELNQPEWQNASSRVVAFTLAPGAEGEPGLHVMLNMSDEECRMAVPAPNGADAWCLAVDTALESPRDILPPGAQTQFDGGRYALVAHSVVVLEGRV
jgi:glycogen operon protein